MIKCIALDFDGTIADYSPGKPNLSGKLFRYLNRFIENGGQAGIVSGRDTGSLRDSITSGGFKWQNPFPSFLGVNESYLILPDDAYGRQNRETRERVMQLNRILLRYASGWMELFEMRGYSLSGWKISHDYSLEYSFRDQNEALEAELLLRETAVGSVPGCRVQRNCRLVSVMDNLCNKGRLVSEAAVYFGFAPYEVLVIGDSQNDESMFDPTHGFLCGTPENGDTAMKETVLTRGGIIGKGTAYDGVLDIFRQYKKQGLL